MSQQRQWLSVFLLAWSLLTVSCGGGGSEPVATTYRSSELVAVTDIGDRSVVTIDSSDVPVVPVVPVGDIQGNISVVRISDLPVITIGSDGSAATNTNAEDTLSPAAANANPAIIRERSTEAAPEEDVTTLVNDINEFGMAAYHSLSDDRGSRLVSPYTAGTAMAMISGAADGETLRELTDAMPFTLNQTTLHPAMNDLDQRLNGLDFFENAPPTSFYTTALTSWGQQDYPIRIDFHNLLSRYYGAMPQSLDFVNNPDGASLDISSWMMEQVPHGAFYSEVSSLARLIVAAVADFQGNWEAPFDPALSGASTFVGLDEIADSVTMMSRAGVFPYAEEEGKTIVELPYAGSRFSMLLLLPDFYEFDDVEASLNVTEVNRLAALLEPRNVLLKLPRFSMSRVADYQEMFSGMGVEEPFQNGRADFSRLNRQDSLYIESMPSRTSLSVDEAGAAAQASTGIELLGLPIPSSGSHGSGVISGMISWVPPAYPPPLVEAVFDHPFIFIIRDSETGAFLFIGRLMRVY